MENLVLLIQWLYGREQINVSLGPEPRDNEIQHTDEYWPDHDKTVTYNTTSERRRGQNGSQQILIHYLKEANSHLTREFRPADLLWGTSTIVVRKDRKSATVSWQGDPPNPRYDGNCLLCRVLSQDLFQEEERESFSRRIKKAG